jgi:hypothetical protein
MEINSSGEIVTRHNRFHDALVFELMRFSNEPPVFFALLSARQPTLGLAASTIDATL